MPLYRKGKRVTENYRYGKKVLKEYRYGKLVYGYEKWWEEFGIRGEYLKSDGTAYIDTGYTLQYDNGTTEIACSPNGVSRTNGIYGFIERSGNLANRISVGISGGWFVGSGATHRIGDAVANTKVNIVWDRDREITWFNNEETETPNVLITGNEYTAYLFSRNDKGKPDADGIYNLIGDVYYLREILDDTVQFNLIPIQVKKQFTDLKGTTHNVGDWIMVNELSYKDVPTHHGTFSGHINVENSIYFKSISEQNPYYDLGRRIAYGKRIVIPISFEDTSIDPYPLYGLFGSRQGYSQSTAYNTFIGRNDLPTAMDVAVDKIPTDRKFTITIEDGKGYIDGVIATTDTTSTSDWNENSFLYNVNTEGLGGAMTTYRLPIGTRVYGCQIYDVATGVIENNYQPQLDQTLKCTITGEVLPKLGINPTDSWDVIDTNAVISQELSWFETVPSSTGIRTNFIPTKTTAALTKIELMCSFTSGSSGYLVNGIGGGPTMYIGMNPSSKLAYGNLGTDSSISYNLNYDTYYKLTIDYKNKTISVNDEVVASNISLSSFSRDDRNFGLNCYVNTVTNNIINNWGQKTQYCKIYVDDILTHHWVGKFNSNKIDIYDKVTKVYLGDLGLIEGIDNIIAGELIKL